MYLRPRPDVSQAIRLLLDGGALINAADTTGVLPIGFAAHKAPPHMGCSHEYNHGAAAWAHGAAAWVHVGSRLLPPSPAAYLTPPMLRRCVSPPQACAHVVPALLKAGADPARAARCGVWQGKNAIDMARSVGCDAGVSLMLRHCWFQPHPSNQHPSNLDCSPAHPGCSPTSPRLQPHAPRPQPNVPHLTPWVPWVRSQVPAAPI